MADIYDWSTTAGSNTTVDGVSIAEGCPAANLNNGMRSIMALVRNSFATALETFLNGTAALPMERRHRETIDQRAAFFRKFIVAMMDSTMPISTTAISNL